MVLMCFEGEFWIMLTSGVVVIVLVPVKIEKSGISL